jgi:hypothetical protein
LKQNIENNKREVEDKVKKEAQFVKMEKREQKDLLEN